MNLKDKIEEIIKDFNRDKYLAETHSGVFQPMPLDFQINSYITKNYIPRSALLSEDEIIEIMSHNHLGSIIEAKVIAKAIHKAQVDEKKG